MEQVFTNFFILFYSKLTYFGDFLNEFEINPTGYINVEQCCGVCIRGISLMPYCIG